MPRTPIEILEDIGGNNFLRSVTFGEVARGTRNLVLQDGSLVSGGGTTFILRKNTVKIGFYIRHQGQVFIVEGLRPVGRPLYRKVMVTTTESDKVNFNIVARENVLALGMNQLALGQHVLGLKD